MCVVSMVIDHYADKWDKIPRQPRPYEYVPPRIYPTYPPTPILPTKEEIDEFHELLKKAREYDIKHHEPECESEEKKARLQRLADELGIKINFDEGEK